MPLTDASTLTARQFEDFSALISDRLGIKMPPSKQVMLQSRLQRRVRELGLPSVQAYHARFFSHPDVQEQELEHLLNLATTNKTDFFREPDHFDYLHRVVVPDWHRRATGPLRVWCAGCSSGEEAYTLAITLLEATLQRPFDFSILATDISTRVLREARDAIYTEDRTERIPPLLRTRYLLRSRDRSQPLVRLAPQVRGHVTFGQLNFLSAHYNLPHPMDVVFFRNVLIYFERDLQRAVVGRICQHLRVGGHLFIAHAETLQGFNLPLRLVAPAVFRRESGPVHDA